MGEVVVDVVGEGAQGGGGEAGGAVRVAAGAAVGQQAGAVAQAGQQAGAGSSGGQGGEVLGHVGQPETAGPHWRALWAARQASIRAVSLSPQAARGSAITTPAPGAAPGGVRKATAHDLEIARLVVGLPDLAAIASVILSGATD